MKCRVNLLLTFFLQFSLLPLFSQHFEWASSGSNMFVGYSTSCVTTDGRLIAGAQYEPPSYQISSDDAEIYSGSGKAFPFNKYFRQFIVTCYSAQGEIDWVIKENELCQNGNILGLSSLADGTVIVAFRGYPNLPAYMKDEKGIEIQVPLNRDYNSSGNYYEYVFLAEIDKYGTSRKIHAIKGIVDSEWISFERTSDGGFVFTQADNEKSINAKGENKDVAHNYITKINSDFSFSWIYKLKYLDKSCCSYFENPSLAVSSYTGDIFIAGNFREGILPDGGKAHTAPILDVVSQYNQPYESYLACLSASGKLKWIRYSEGKSLISAISVHENQIIVGGKIQLQKNYFGMKIDTTNAKVAILASFDLAGKSNWCKTFNAINITSISQDFDGNIYASFRNKRSRGVPPLMIGTDSIPDAYERVIVASFDEKGNYRWNKISRAMLSIDSHSKIHNDDCGNLYFTGEMWYSLPVNMSLFDGAIVRGKGYGGAPLAARIRTTIPDELLALNMNLSQSLQIKLREKNKEKNSSNNSIKLNNAPVLSDSLSLVDTSAQPNSVHASRCVPIPFPWSLVLFPNPTDGQFTARATISYCDSHVGVELWDAKGAFVKQLSAPHMQLAGSFDVEGAISDLAAGVYIVVLKGSNSAVSERLIKK